MAESAAKPPVVHIATSAGGHIELMVALRTAFDGYRRVWIVQPSLRAEVLAREGEAVIELPDYDRHPLRGHYLSNITKALRLVLRDQPRVVVTSGAGATVPFCVLARLFGARVVFVETMARVTGPSSSGKVLSRLASRVLVQWAEVAEFYPRTTVCRPALLRSVGTGERAGGQGVFVGVGTHIQAFDRLLETVDRAAGKGILPRPIVAQGGPSTYQPRHYELRDWLSPEEVSQAIGAAEYVICHAGSGLMSSALQAGRRPLVLPRRATFDEHFDDHQTQIVAKLADVGLVVPIDGQITEADLAAARQPLRQPDMWGLEPNVAEALRSELESALGTPPETPPAASRRTPRLASTATERRIA
jgi:UDP-N-acetylglucosamine--N-acetylmuramyl-(pentapeptide) pyrophosphoryl-undecaprenol N-acetylglucosamine transferase